MIPKSLLSLLLSYKNLYIICLGDPFQLPVINKEEDNLLLNKPHIFLDEVMRQAQESEIIRLTMDIRKGKKIFPMRGRDVIIVKKKDFNTGMMRWADQMICSTNLTRKILNKEMRKLQNREGEPQDGDKIICLKNYWDILSDDKIVAPLINGTTGVIQKINSSYKRKFPSWIPESYIEILDCNFMTDSNAIFKDLKLDKNMIVTEENSLSQKSLYRLSKPKTNHLIPMEFTYGYAITCHKAQGSEWKNVLAIEEDFPYNKEEHDKLLYTCATRATEKLVLCLKGE